MTTQDLIIVHQQNGVLKLGINRPAKKNALTKAMYATLCEQLGEASRNDAIKVVLLYGENQMFCSGNDLFDFDNRKSGEKSPAQIFLHTLNEFEKPVIAAVSGFAVGIGVTMLMHCDIVYAGEKTRFNMPFINLGVVPEGASTLLLPKNAGYKAAAKALFLGEFFDAPKAVNLDIVTQVTDEKKVLKLAEKTALDLSEKPFSALMLTKKMLKQSSRMMIAQRIDEECAHFEKLLLCEESITAREKVKNKKK